MTSPFSYGFYSIRSKLTLAIVTPLVLILVLVALAASFLINASIVEQTQKQIRNDLNAARTVLEREQQRLYEVVRFTARSLPLSGTSKSADPAALGTLLSEIRQQEQLDILNIANPQGKLLLQAGVEQVPRAADFVLRALADGPYQGMVLLSETEMEHESQELALRAQIDGPAAGGKPLERRGMFLVAAVPLLDRSGLPVGCLYGGVMLNNNVVLVDRISELVYGQDTFEGVAVGSATIFLKELRVATTVRLKSGERAIGTKISPRVAEAVLERKEIWLDRALVVNEWYLTDYEPIMNDRGEAIGALYVGMLEKPLVAVKNRAFLTLFGLLIVGSLFGGLLAGWLAQRLSKPVLALARSAEKIASGQRDVSLPVAGHDEIGHLTTAFAKMTNALRVSDLELQELNRQLEKKVAQRTSQLEEKSLELIQTQEQLLHQEKLAAIGSLASGVAHEINNPAAIIRGNVEILQMGLAADAGEQEELAEILKQVERISLITRNLLSSSREQDLDLEPVPIPDLLDDILDQLSHHAPMAGIEIKKSFATQLPAVEGDRERLRQVFTNILLNAVQAMAGKGELCLSGSAHGQWVRVKVADTGPGINETVRGKIFNPFFTTKSDGTGLGLSVSYGVIRAHGGSITVSSSEGQGTVFQIDLPLKRRFTH